MRSGGVCSRWTLRPNPHAPSILPSNPLVRRHANGLRVAGPVLSATISTFAQRELHWANLEVTAHLDADGSFYGVTTRGGDADPQRAGGTIYKIAADGTFSVLHRFVLAFEGNPEPWLVPFGPSAGLTLAADGFFYGTTMSSDIFRISPQGGFALVHQFSAESEPQNLVAALIVAADGYLYTTSPTVLSLQFPPGSIFRVSLGGDAEVLYRFRDFGNPPPGFSGTPDGAHPKASSRRDPMANSMAPTRTVARARRIGERSFGSRQTARSPSCMRSLKAPASRTLMAPTLEVA